MIFWVINKKRRRFLTENKYLKYQYTFEVGLLREFFAICLDLSPCATGVTENVENSQKYGIRVDRKIYWKPLILIFLCAISKRMSWRRSYAILSIDDFI